jgi:hypothetical protein
MFLKHCGLAYLPITKGFNFSLPSELQQSSSQSFFTFFVSMAWFPLHADGFVREQVVKQPCFIGIEYVPWFIILQ